MKGFVFTLDAIFSLIFAAAAITALVYVSYSGYTPPSIQSGQVSSIATTLATASLQKIGISSPLYGTGSSGIWPQYGANQGYSFGGAYGPTAPYLIYAYAASANIIPAVVASGGYVAFASGNQLYELNATTGALANGYPVSSSTTLVSAPVYYKSSLIYANSAGHVFAVSASNGLSQLWNSNIGYTLMTSPLQIEQGYITFATNSLSAGKIYFLDPANGSVAESDPTSTSGGGSQVYWIANRKGSFYIGIGAGKTFNSVLLHEFVNVSIYPSNSFASFGNFTLIGSKGSAAMYGSLTAYYSMSSGVLNITSVPYYSYAHRASYTLASATFNTTPSIGGNLTYLLYKGQQFEAFGQGSQLFNVTLPKSTAPFAYNYSDIALAYGNAYLAEGNTLYAFGAGGQIQQNSSMLAALGDLYLAGRGGLADKILYSIYGAGNIGIYINGSYAPTLHVSKFNGINSYVAIPASRGLSPAATSGNMSLCGWYKINSLAGYHGLLFKGTQAPSSGNVPEFAVDLGGDGRGFAIYDSAGDVAASYNSALSSNAVGSWYAFCLTYNQSGDTAYYYLNGTQYTGTVNTAFTPSAGTGAIVVGAGVTGASGSAKYSNVSVADLQLYNTSISQARVTELYEGGMYSEPSNSSGLVGWWPLLGDGNDYSGGGHVGFPSNTFFISSTLLPPEILGAVQIGGSALPLQLINNGVSRTYNVSVVVWSG